MTPTEATLQAPAQKGGFRTYLSATRDPFTSAVLVLPLFLLYQVGILATGGMRNGVDFVTNILFAAFGGNMMWYVAFNAVVLVAFIGAILVLRKRGHFDPRVAPWMFLETTVYAVLLGSVVIALINVLGLGGLLSAAGKPAAGMTFVDKLVMSAGAGLYKRSCSAPSSWAAWSWRSPRVCRCRSCRRRRWRSWRRRFCSRPRTTSRSRLRYRRSRSASSRE